MRHHFAHLNRIDVSVGQQVSKGQQIGLMGKTGTGSVHLHWEVQKIFRTWTAYTQGMSRQSVLDHYRSPYDYDWKSVAPFSHLGWDWLSDISKGQGQLHPGLDINSKSGDGDLNTPIKSPVSGKVIYVGEGGGWGKHIFIEEGDNMLPENQLQGRLEIDSSGKVWWWTPSADWFHHKWELVATRQERIIEKPVDREVIKEVIKEVEKVVEVKIPVEITRTIIEQVMVEKELTDEQKTVLSVWEKIKDFYNKLIVSIKKK